jgi:hypothetical protein
MKHIVSVELSDRELHFIGTIIAQWGALEYEIFSETIMTYAEDGSAPVHPKISSLQLTDLLDLWHERVIVPSDDRRKRVRTEQLALIKKHQELRNALVHGMWEWDVNEPHKITTTRIHKKKVIRFTLTADDLQSLAIEIGEIRYNVRYPGGDEDRARELIESKGGYISREFVRSVLALPSDELAERVRNARPKRPDPDK